MNKDIKIALTGFMGVGKSSVARHLARRARCRWTDLDRFIERNDGRIVAQIIDEDGVDRYREIETANLKLLLSDTDSRILSLGGGTWTIPENRELLKAHGFTGVWLEATFEHCWLNITFSRKEQARWRATSSTPLNYLRKGKRSIVSQTGTSLYGPTTLRMTPPNRSPKKFLVEKWYFCLAKPFVFYHYNLTK